jgi:CYTH domain-containing protein
MNKEMKEIECKYLIQNPPENYSDWDCTEIRQGYLAVTDDGREVRIRKKGDAFFQTVKLEKGFYREEIEIPITKDQFDVLWPATSGKRINKKRFTINYNGQLIEMDIYQGRLEGLIVAEVEFDNEENCRRFEPPSWFDKEISNDEKYKNRNLAQ